MQILRRAEKSDDYNHQISGTEQRINSLSEGEWGAGGGAKQQQQIEFLFGYDKMHYVFLKSLKVCLGFSPPSAVPIVAECRCEWQKEEDKTMENEEMKKQKLIE